MHNGEPMMYCNYYATPFDGRVRIFIIILVKGVYKLYILAADWNERKELESKPRPKRIQEEEK